MASSDSSLPPIPPLSEKKENAVPISSKITELTESRQDLLNRINNLKQDLHTWRSKLDDQVKVYREELSELKKTLNVEVDQLRSEFQELKTNIQQQQEDVTESFKHLGLKDIPAETEEANGVIVENKEGKEVGVLTEDNVKEFKN